MSIYIIIYPFSPTATGGLVPRAARRKFAVSRTVVALGVASRISRNMIQFSSVFLLMQSFRTNLRVFLLDMRRRGDARSVDSETLDMRAACRITLNYFF